MQLEKYLKTVAEQSQSYFQAHLAREDIERVQRLKQTALEAQSVEDLLHDALYLGWTPGDLRTGELKEEIEQLVRAMHAYLSAPKQSDLDDTLLLAWKAFHEKRITVLIHCL